MLRKLAGWLFREPDPMRARVVGVAARARQSAVAVVASRLVAKAYKRRV